MKLLYYKAGRKGKNNKSFNISFDHILFAVCVSVFFILIIVQTALISPTVRTFLEVQNGYEGQPLGVEEFLYAEGTLELRLYGVEGNEGIRVMVNGDMAAVFNTNIVKIKVKDGDVVEIDTSAAEGQYEIEVISQTSNIKNQCTSIRISLEQEVKRLVRTEVE